MFSLPIDDTSPIETWDTSQITSMYKLFDKRINSVFENCNPDVSKWNVDNVVNFVSPMKYPSLCMVWQSMRTHMHFFFPL